MPAGRGAGSVRAIAPFAALSASYFAHIGFFNPYLTLWLKHLGLPIAVIALLASVQSVTRVFAPYLWGMLSDHTGERVRLLRWSACVAFAAALGLWWPGGPWWIALVLLVGDAPYYARFGFTPDLTAGLDLPGPVDRARFLGLELVPGALSGASGVLQPAAVMPVSHKPATLPLAA